MAVKHKKTNKPDNIIVHNINIMNAPHNTQDIQIWKSAIRAFENLTNPSRVALYDLYEDIILDGQIEATWCKRQDAVLNQELVFVRDGVEDEQINKLLNSPDMRIIIKELHNSIAWGFTLIQINNIYYDENEEVYKIDFDLIPRKHVHPEEGFECVSRQQSIASKDFLFMEQPIANYMLWAGEKKDKGIFAKTAQYVIYKRGGFGDWSQFAEMFGMPFRELIYDDYDEATRKKLEKGLQEWGSAGYSLHPRSADLKIHPTGGSTGSNEVYDRLIAACDASISKTILGNTLTTEQGENGARSLGEVHKEVEDAKTASDKQFILSILNTKFRAILKRFGFNVTGGDIWYRSDDKDWTELQTKWNVINSISDKIPVADDFIYEEFSIPKPENYEQLKEELKLKNSFNPFENPLQNHLNDDKTTIKGANNLLGRIHRFFVQSPSRMGELSGNAHTPINQNNLNEALVLRVWNGEANYWDTDLFFYITNNLLSALDKSLVNPQLGAYNQIAYDAPDDVFRTALEQNLFHFSAAKTLAEIQALNQALNEAKDYSDFRKRADKITDTFNRRWQQTEYQSAVNCAESASTFRRLKSKTKLFPYWEYKTAGDDKVREEHAALAGTILRHDDPLWDSIYPPNGWKCRCYVVPRMQSEANISEDEQHEKVAGYMKTKDWQNAVAQHWNINRAKQGIVFDANQMYIRKFPDNAAAYMDKIKPDKWGLDNSIKKLQQQATENSKKYEGTAEDFWNNNKKIIDGKEYLVLEDYNGRKWRMNKDDFDKHTTNRRKKRFYRVEFLSNVFEVAKNPDEVWLGRTDEDKGNNIKTLDNYIFLKHYKDQTIAVAGKIKGDNLLFSTWFPVRDKKVREGILIKKRQ